MTVRLESATGTVVYVAGCHIHIEDAAINAEGKYPPCKAVWLDIGTGNVDIPLGETLFFLDSPVTVDILPA